MEKDIRVWGIHTEDEHLFLERKNPLIAIGWRYLGDIRKYGADREKIKVALSEKDPYYRNKKGAVPGAAGMLYRFAFEVQIGDYVVFPSKFNRKINIGKVIGEYAFVGEEDIKVEDDVGPGRFAHMRKVEWLSQLPRTVFTQGALYEAGAAQTFFSIKNYADEYLSALEDPPKQVLGDLEDNDEEIEASAEATKERTKDYVLKELSRHYRGYALEDFIAALLKAMGYKVEQSPKGGDRGKDIIAYKDDLPPRILVQVKSSDDNTRETELQAFRGTLLDGDYGFFVSLADYSKNAKDFLKNNRKISAVTGSELVDLILKYYDSLDQEFKVHIPLERVFIPDKNKIL